MQLFNQQGQPVEVPTEHVSQALLSGEYGLPEGSTVPVQKKDGTIAAVPVEEFAREAKAGAVPVSHEDLLRTQLEQRRGGAVELGKTALEGGARGATFGLSDVVGGALGGDEYRTAARERREANPLTAGVSELAGTVAPALLTGGASEGASAGATAAREGLAVADAAKETGLFGRGLQAAGRTLAAPTELASTVGQTFERGVQSIVGKEGTSLAARMAQDAAALGARGAADGAAVGFGQELSEQSLEGSGTLNGEKLLAAAGHGALLGGIGGGALGAAGELATGVIGRAARRFDGAAEEVAVHALTGGDKAAAEVLSSVPGGTKAVGRYALDNGIVTAGDTVESSLPKIQKAVQSETSAIGKSLASADSAGLTGPKLGPRQLGFVEAHDMLGTIDTQIAAGAVAKTELPILVAARDDLEKSIAKSLRSGSSELADAFDDAKANLTKAQALEASVTKVAADRASTPQRSGLAHVGAALLTGHPLGAVAGLAHSLASSYVHQHGAAVAAVSLDKLAQLQAVRRAAMTVDREIDRGVARIAEKGTTRGELRAPSGSYDDKRAKVEKAAANIDMHADMVQTAAAGLQPHAAQASAGFVGAAKRAISYLAAAMPPRPTRDGLLPSTHIEDRTPADQQATFERKYDAVNDPTIVLAHAHEGTLTADEIDAVKSTHPELLEQMRSKVRAEISTMDPKTADAMPLAKQQAISTLLGTPIGNSVSPDVSRAAQQIYQVEPPPTKQTGGAPKRKFDLTNTGLTSTHRPF